MDALQDTPFEACFLEGSAGRLFGLCFPAVGEPRGKLLCIPPFTEESNRCRVMLGMAARALAQRGFTTLIIDLYGTGNSEGVFEEATWDTWLRDIHKGVDWLADRAGPLTLWGTRLGALLACEAAPALQGQVHRLMFWQPVSNARQMFTQYLRLRVANSQQAGGRQETTKELRQRLQDGETLEVGGYYITPGLAASLDAAEMKRDPGFDAIRVDWLERVDEGKSELLLPSRKLLDAWRESGVEASGHAFEGPPFWQLHERFLAPRLVDLSCELMER